MRAYREHGNFGIYLAVRRLVDTFCPQEQRFEQLSALRSTTLTFREAQKLEIFVIGSEPTTVMMNDQEVGRQPGMWYHRDPDYVPEWKTFTLSVLPGDVVEFRVEQNGPPGSLEFIMIHARIGDRVVPASAFRSMDPGRPARLGPVTFGTVVEMEAPPGKSRREAPQRGVKFDDEPDDRHPGWKSGSTTGSVKDCAFQWFEKHRVEIICVRGTRVRRCPVLVVPDLGK